MTIGATNQGLVAGDLVNTASRLQSVAQPGTVLVGEATQRAASKAIAFEPAGEQALKGKASPVPAWRALRVVAQVGGRNRADALEAPFVGRDDELRLLKDLFHATTREGRSRLVSVIGPAGIGKTRLAWEFLKYVDGLVETVWWHEGRSPAYGEGVTFWALGEMVRRRAGLLETDDEATTRAKIAATVAEHVPDPDERRWIESALLTLLGVEAGGASDQLFGAWRTFFERLAATAPVVLVFEDYHYADPGLLDFVDHLLEWSRTVPIYVVTLSRPELLDKRPAWGAGKRNFVNVSLEPLPEPAMRVLLAGLVPGLPERAVKAIVARADGVPLYAVETVRMLLAQNRLVLEGDAYHPTGDLTDLAVPETLTALIGSRLDSLAPSRSRPDPGRRRIRAELHDRRPRRGVGRRRGRARAAPDPPRPRRAAHEDRGSAQPRTRSVRLRAGAHPRGGVPHAQQGRPGRRGTWRQLGTWSRWGPRSWRARWPATTWPHPPAPPRAPRRAPSRRRRASPSGPRRSGRVRSAPTPRPSRSWTRPSP